MKYRLIIFDFDGTLADSLAWFAHTLNTLADQYHYKKLSPAEQQAMRGYDNHTILRQIGLSPWKIPFLGRHLRRLMKEETHRFRLFHGVDEMLRDLSGSGAVLALASSNGADNIERIMGPELSALIRYYECGVSIFGKASRIKRLLRLTRIPAREAILIGDEVRDGEAAAQAGVAFGAVSWGYNTLEALSQCRPAESFTSIDHMHHRLL